MKIKKLIMYKSSLINIKNNFLNFRKKNFEFYLNNKRNLVILKSKFILFKNGIN